jgi:hypothetical protein
MALGNGTPAWAASPSQRTNRSIGSSRRSVRSSARSG